MFKLNQIDGGSIVLKIDDDLYNHFSDNNKNHALTILKQINDLHFYDYLFTGSKNLTILDIGANIGLFSLHVLPVCSRIIAFEPTPSHYEKLLKLTKDTKIECRQIALSDSYGEVTFNLDPYNSTMNSIVNANSSQSIKVRCVDLKKIMKSENLESVDFCKVDIEGSEVIAITENTLKPIAGKIKEFFIEVHPTTSLDGMNQSQNKLKLWNIFENVGYTVTDVNFETFIAKWNK